MSVVLLDEGPGSLELEVEGGGGGGELDVEGSLELEVECLELEVLAGFLELEVEGLLNSPGVASMKTAIIRREMSMIEALFMMLELFLEFNVYM